MTHGAGASPADSGIGEPTSALTAALAAAAATAVGRALAARLPVNTRSRWQRSNHAGQPVTLLEGPVWVAGAAAGLALASMARSGRGVRRRQRHRRDTVGPALLVVVGSGALGVLDDVAGSAKSKGLRGHLGALRRGEVTTGAIKVLGLAATGVAAALLADRNEVRHPVGTIETLLGGAVIAGAANAANLFDLRPGRALKVVLVCAAPLALNGSAAAAAALGASAGVIRDDLAGTSMLGDTGANAAGALVGLALVESMGLRGRLLALGGLTALTLASERVSFTRVIEANPTLRRLDEWGRART